MLSIIMDFLITTLAWILGISFSGLLLGFLVWLLFIGYRGLYWSFRDFSMKRPEKREIPEATPEQVNERQSTVIFLLLLIFSPIASVFYLLCSPFKKS